MRAGGASASAGPPDSRPATRHGGSAPLTTAQRFQGLQCVYPKEGAPGGRELLKAMPTPACAELFVRITP